MSSCLNSPPPPPLLRLTDSHTPDLRAVSSRSVNLLCLTATALSLTLLVACGGGGSGGGGTPTVMLEPLPDPLVANPDQARQYLNAVSPATPPAVLPPSLSSTQIGQRIRSIAINADTLLYDIVGGTSVTCEGISCTYMNERGFEIEVSLDGFESVDTGEIPGYTEQNTAVMIHNGITIGERLNAGRQEFEDAETIHFESQAYGGWDDNNTFAIQRDMETTGSDVTIDVVAYSIGKATGTRPTTGTGRWSGTMVGSHTQMNYLVQGSANIRINDFNENRLTILSLFNIKRLDTGANVNNLDWTAVPINMDGTFDKDGEVKGTFYGANHEEIGGTFNKDNIIGAFGGTQTGQ